MSADLPDPDAAHKERLADALEGIHQELKMIREKLDTVDLTEIGRLLVPVLERKLH